MALPASPPLSLSQIKAEFSGPNNFSAYHRGGGYVPDNAYNTAIPTSGAMSFSQFFGARSTAPLSVVTPNRSDSRTDATSPYIRFVDDGTVTKSGVVADTNWGSPTTSGAGAGYEILFHKNSGNGVSNGDALDTWLSINTPRLCGISAAPNTQSRTANFTYTIRYAAGATIGSGTITVDSDRT